MVYLNGKIFDLFVFNCRMVSQSKFEHYCWQKLIFQLYQDWLAIVESLLLDSNGKDFGNTLQQNFFGYTYEKLPSF